MIAYEDRLRWVKENPEILANHAIVANIVIEHIISEQHVHAAATGYDYIHSKHGKGEIKATCFAQRKELRIQSYHSKRNRCDFIHIGDGVNDRQFRIPHDAWFTYIDKSCGGSKEFRWSASYNATDNVRVNNTNFLLQYEIEGKK